MKALYSAPIVSLGALFFVAACATTPAETPEPERGAQEEATGVQVDRSGWSEEQWELERAFENYLQSDLLRRGLIAQGGMEAMREEATLRAENQRDLEGRFRVMIQGSNDPEVVAWASFRLGQVYLDFGCRLVSLDNPGGLDEEMTQMHRQSIMDLSLPLIEQSERLVEHAVQTEEEPWFQAGQKLRLELSRFSEAPEEVCESTEELWQRDGEESDRK